MSGHKPAFPSPAPAPVLISDSGKGDSDSEISPNGGSVASTNSQPQFHQHVHVMPTGPQNDEELEILSVHEQLVDEALARSPETARVSDFLTAQENEANLNTSTVYLQSEHGQVLQERLKNLAAAFRARSLQAKQAVMQAPTADLLKPEAPPPPKADESVLKPAEPKEAEKKKAPPPPPPPKRAEPEPPPPVIIKLWKLPAVKVPEWYYKIPRPPSFDPHSRIYLAWLSLVSMCFVYNAIVIPLRAAFYVQDPDNLMYWLIIDYFCDLVYLLDLIIWKPSIRAYVNGIEVTDKKEIMRVYVVSDDFILDICCLIPLDLFYLVPELNQVNGTVNPLFRLLRLIKIHSYWELLDRIDLLFTNPYYFRVLRSVAYMMYLIHANACIFFYFSYWKNFSEDDSFVYNNERPRCQNATADSIPDKCNFPGKYNAYIFCFFFSVSMVTIIGNLNFPAYISEMIYSTILWFLGVFVFATLVGQIRDVLKAMTRQEDEFYEVMDAIVEHMHTLKIPKELQERVRTWLLYNWEQQKTIDEGRLLEGLPVKLRTDLAMEVHFSTIHKVQLFKDVDKKVLEELLLRLKPSVYLPNDYICKRGEIGKEMYIIRSGILEVVLPDGRVAVTLTPGSVFGEISLLALAGGNRRTADVRSKGFSNLYVLSKADLNDVMKDYPETLDALKLKAQELMNKGKPPPEKPPTPPPVEIIPTRPPTPEMVRVALSVLKPTSVIRRRLSQSAMELTVFRNHKSDDDSGGDDVELPMTVPAADKGNSQRARTPEPVQDVPVTASITSIKSEPAQKRSTESLAQKQSIRRRRSAVNVPSDSSDNDEATGTYSSQSRLQRRKKHHRTPSNMSHSVHTLRSVGSPAPISKLTTPDKTFYKERAATPLTSVTKSSSLTNLKRRFFSTPKIAPIETEHDANELQPPSARGPIPIPRKLHVFELGPIPDNPVGSATSRNVSFSDHEFSNLSDNFAAVTFSSPETS
ncbi:cyclic nucleotide-gated cation channel beta-3-like [Paramacrobiotus metropolitanus]|uniref:cyclic nucleotide-gated cation channel beta-3-like n=1 Tax=Paramacrobiotus metropolitanus TaxID=2943436 RepID=UPI002445EF77|nr:cyclic nucleotide-gated cation channel beta-3-like [Paramacrobiotus metropolitanus]